MIDYEKQNFRLFEENVKLINNVRYLEAVVKRKDTEIGQLKSYIDELRDRIEKINSNLPKIVDREEKISKLQEAIKRRDRHLLSMRKSYSELISKSMSSDLNAEDFIRELDKKSELIANQREELHKNNIFINTMYLRFPEIKKIKNELKKYPS